MDILVPTDDELLRRLGLTDSELREMQARYYKFAEELKAPERASLLKSIPTAKEAAATLGPDVTPERLEAFLKARSFGPGAVVFRNRTGEAEH